MAKNSTFNISLKLLAEQFNRGIKDIQKQVRGLGNFIKGAFAVGSITAFGRQMVQTATDFEDAMARVRSVSNASNRELKMMTDEARKLGATTRYTATEAASALENLTRNGMSSSDATKSLSGVLKLAQANAIGLAEAADIVSNTLNMFGMEAKDTETVNDILSSTAANSATNISLLYEALVNAAPAAKVLGIGLDETSAAIGALAQKGVKGANAGTALRMALTKMVDPKIVAKMQEMGISIDEQVIKEEGLLGVVRRLKDANLSMSQAVEIFSQKGAVGIQQLIGAYDEFDRMLNVTRSSAGTTARMFEQGVGTTRKALDELKSTWEALLININNSTSGVFNRVIKTLTNVINAFQDTGTRVTAVVSTLVTVIGIKLVNAIQNARVEAAKTGASMSILRAGITTVTAAAKAAYAAMGGWIGILMTLGSVILTKVVSSLRKQKEEMNSIEEANARAEADAKKEESTLRKLYDIINDNTKALSVRKRALAELKTTVKDYHGSLTEEGKLTNDNSDAIDTYCKKLAAKMRLEVREARLKELIEKREIAAAEALAKENEKPSFGEYFSGWLASIGQTSSDLPGELPKTPKENAEEIHREAVKAANDRVKQIEDEIKEYNDNEIAKALEAVLAIESINPNGGGGGGGNGKTDLEKANERLDDAIKEYAKSVGEAKVKQELGISNAEETNKAIMSAESTLIDAYIEASQIINDENVLERQQFKTILESFKARAEAEKKAAAAAKEDAEAKERQANAIKAVGETRKKYNEADAKNKNKNPWDTFTADPKEYKKEAIALQDLEAELERLQSAYDACKDEVSALKESGTEEAKELLEWYNKLGDKLPGAIQRVVEARNNLYSKRAKDIIEEKEREKIDTFYNHIKTCTNGVGTLISSLETLADSDWSDMSFGERFNAISNAIYGTVDAIKSAIESFRTLFEVMDALRVAKESYAAVEAATSAQVVQGKQAEASASIAAAAAEVAAGEAAEANAVKQATSAATTVSANTAEAVSGAAASQASIPVVGPILVPAAIAAVLAAIAASLPAFANGGIIQGYSKTGDKLLARVNAGEMILNKSQQSRLFELANGHGGLNGRVEFIIDAKTIKGVLRNYDRSNAKIAGGF